jgi:hypothetical protein
MALSLASPGIRVREVDLTRGGIQNTTSLSAGIAAPFAKGPVNQIVTIRNEDELKRVFGSPYTNDNHYEYWYSASNFLSYGGSLKVVRCSGDDLKNANAGVAATTASLKIENYDDYKASYENSTSFFWSAKNPGYWAEDLRVCVIDHLADQTVSGIATGTLSFNTTVSSAATVGVTTTRIIGVTTTSVTLGQFIQPIAGIIGSGTTVTGIGSAFVDIGTTTLNGTEVTTTLNFGSYSLGGGAIQVGYGVTQALAAGTIAGVGTTSVSEGYIKGIVTGVGSSEIQVKVVSKIVGGVETTQGYTENGIYAFRANASIDVLTSAGLSTATVTPPTVEDWYNTQNVLDIARGDSVTIPWRSIAPKPTSSAYVTEKGGGGDSIHVVVVDSKKANNISGTTQSILEKFVNLSKAVDAVVSPTNKIYYKDYLALNSAYVYAGKSLGDATNATWGVDPVAVKFTSGFNPQAETSGYWGLEAEGRTFNAIGNKSFDLTGGKDYNGGIAGFRVSLSNIVTAYNKFANDAEVDVNYLLQGGASLGKEIEQAKANAIIAIAEARKDCMAFISPSRESVVNVTSQSEQLTNVLSFFTPLTSSSYGVFDSGYQYIYDRFNQQFVYIPCSADVAGLCVRTDINQFPWFSPAGKNRGSLNFPIKLAYNPGQGDRDQLYSQRINPIISSPGAGIILFGDKTALNYQSAFDRINVRKLFITIERAIKQAADSQLFEFNDSATRANFVNIVEPYLRDVQVKRGITDFLLICDESNNTPDVVDRNEFIADIYVKPARSINFIGLTFVATRTGVSFETVVGTV